MADDSWEHPVLGRVRFVDDMWRTEARLPALGVFRYSWDSAQQRDSSTCLVFEGEERPSEAAIELAVRVIEQQESLPDRLRMGLWNDLTGTGPDSGMWWHGNLDDVNEDEDDEPIRGPADLDAHLGAPQVIIQESVYGTDGPVAEVAFSASFEIEHGISLLYDGNAVIGLGYQCDALPFGADD